MERGGGVIETTGKMVVWRRMGQTVKVYSERDVWASCGR